MTGNHLGLALPVGALFILLGAATLLVVGRRLSKREGDITS